MLIISGKQKMTQYAPGSLFNLEAYIFYNIRFVYYHHQNMEGQEVRRDNILEGSRFPSSPPGATVSHFLNRFKDWFDQ